ncbi:SGNH/GDSL hydrolase family protein [Bradyrhizobium embrapense]|uniref:SGNH/GDSL hydrolase family protein n=1 Tax=Bradyrhizobium embrapense TaxID=630921 RepID=UPI00067AFAA1|nr:SGNH/GDSL hydrolase family protein [Bradyrhizobium embrapense]
MPTSRPCETHLELVKFAHRLPHFAEALRHQRKIKVVTLGSSSTAGADNILPFPPRLEILLRQRFFGRMIDVINRGIGGQEAPEEYSRIESDVTAEAPALVIWQVGTNAVYKSYNPAEVRATLEAGLDVLAAEPLDVIVMDSQYTQAIVGTDAALNLANAIMPMIADVTSSKGVNLFSRFALMKRWADAGIPLGELDDGGQLHTSEWATNCVTQSLFGAIDETLKPEAIT